MIDSVPASDEAEYVDRTTAVPVPPRTILLPRWLRPQPALWSWMGAVLVAASFGLIAYTWIKVSGETMVYRQLPYFVSGGFTALVLAIAGVLLVNLSARQADAHKRERQNERLIALLEDLAQALSAPGLPE